MNYQQLAKQFHANNILTAPPGKVTLMLFDGALRFIEEAKKGFDLDESQLRRNEIIHNNITRARDILIELQTSLNLKDGGTFAETMYGLYNYMLERLLEANLQKNIDGLLETQKRLQPIRDAWEDMLNNQNPKDLPKKNNPVQFSSEA